MLPSYEFSLRAGFRSNGSTTPHMAVRRIGKSLTMTAKDPESRVGLTRREFPGQPIGIGIGRVEEHGGKILFPKTALPKMAWFARITVQLAL